MSNAIDLAKRHSGAHNELVATVWLLRQGYEVFRNVSMHGAVDLVAIKDGKVELFDVKKSSYQNDGTITRPKFSQEQKALGVRCLCVFDNGDCLIDDRSRFDGDTVERVCKGCKKPFTLAPGQKRTFCSPRCSLTKRRAERGR